MKSSELYVGQMVACRDYKYGSVYKAQIIALGVAREKHERPTHTIKHWNHDGTESSRSIKPHNIVNVWTPDHEAARQEQLEVAEEQQVINDLKTKLAASRQEQAEEVAHLANLLGLDADTREQWRHYTDSEGRNQSDRISIVTISNLKRLEEIVRPLIAQKLLGGPNP